MRGRGLHASRQAWAVHEAANGYITNRSVHACIAELIRLGLAQLTSLANGGGVYQLALIVGWSPIFLKSGSLETAGRPI